MNPKIVTGIMGKMLPFRWGIEFECLGNIDHTKQTGILEDELNIFDITRDNAFPSNDSMNEHRLSGFGYKHLKGLYRCLQLMQKNCRDAKGAGIHVHIDTTWMNEDHDSCDKDRRLMMFFSNQEILQEVYEIFGSKYTGSYNKRDASYCKGFWIRIAQTTVEFRIGNLTFDYGEIVLILIKLQALVKRAGNKLHVDSKLTKKALCYKKM